MNKVFLIGNLVRDPESREVNNVAVCKFTLAVQRRFKQDTTDFIPIVTWRSVAENCFKYLEKGNKVAVSGELQIRTYESNGEKRTVTEVVADEVKFLVTNNQKESTEQNSEPVASIDADKEDLPF